MKPLTILRKARALLDDPQKWCQKAYAKTKWGNHIGPETKAAAQWCAVGAMRKVAGAGDISDALRMLDTYVRDGDIVSYNDAKCRKHAQVLKVFDRAIAKMEKEQV